MVINCPECSTKFRVNPERIPDAGAKVRCARCKHVFLVEKSIPEEVPAPIIAEPVAPPAEPVVEEKTEAADEQQHVNSADTEEDGFSYDQFRDLDATKSEDEDFTFGGEEEVESAVVEEPSADSVEDTNSDDFDEDDAFSFSAQEEEPAVEKTDDSLTEADSTEDDNKEEPEAPEEEEKVADVFAEEESEAEPEAPTPAVTPQKSNPSSSIIRVLLLLVLGLVIIGGALYFINGPEQLEQAIQQIFGQQTSPAESGKIDLTNLEGKFIKNKDAGELFVIRGEATNNFNEARAAIQVKGVIFDPNGKPLLQKTIFCGNPINDQELQVLPFDKLEEMMRNQFGKSLNNMKVNSKDAIPFVIAFRNLPKNLSEFSVDVTSSEPAVK